MKNIFKLYEISIDNLLDLSGINLKFIDNSDSYSSNHNFIRMLFTERCIYCYVINRNQTTESIITFINNDINNAVKEVKKKLKAINITLDTSDYCSSSKIILGEVLEEFCLEHNH